MFFVARIIARRNLQKNQHWIAVLIPVLKQEHILLQLRGIYSRFINNNIPFKTLPTVSLDLYKGVKLGRLFLSTE
jgi:hypothetical protein